MADVPAIPSAPVGDLDLDRDADEEEWERRVVDLASVRISAARAARTSRSRRRQRRACLAHAAFRHDRRVRHDARDGLMSPWRGR